MGSRRAQLTITVLGAVIAVLELALGNWIGVALGLVLVAFAARSFKGIRSASDREQTAIDELRAAGGPTSSAAEDASLVQFTVTPTAASNKLVFLERIDADPRRGRQRWTYRAIGAVMIVLAVVESFNPVLLGFGILAAILGFDRGLVSLRANWFSRPAVLQSYTIVLTADALVVTTAQGELRHPWTSYTWWRDRPRSFAMQLGGAPAGITVILKEWLADDQIEAVREILRDRLSDQLGRV